MYFVCENCSTALRTDPRKIPSKPVSYRCKTCGHASVVQEHLHDTLPGHEPSKPSGSRQGPSALGTCEQGVDLPSGSADLDGTVYHHVSGVSEDVLSATYELLCAVKSLDGKVSKYRFEKPKITVGRVGGDIVVSDPLVSRTHLELERVKGQVILKDLGSTNGTYVNETSVAVRILKEGDVVRIGNAVLKVAVRWKEA